MHADIKSNAGIVSIHPFYHYTNNSYQQLKHKVS